MVAFSPETIGASILEFLSNEILADGIRLSLDDRFGDAGIDSLALLKVLFFVDVRYGFWIPDEDLTPENVRNARALGAYVHRQLSKDDSA